MTAITKMTTYDLVGKKLSFANWISNLSPTETPFVSMTGKESITQTMFQWQTDRLPAPDPENAVIEGSEADESVFEKTTVKTNVTQILNKVVQVSDTSNTVAAFGRGKEVQYQMEKAGLEIKRDLEIAFLKQGKKVDGSSNTARKTAGFQGLVGEGSFDENHRDPDTSAQIMYKTADADLKEEDIFTLTYNMYLANSKANTIMFHPKWAPVFAYMVEEGNIHDGADANRIRMFDGMTDKLNIFVDTVVDPLGQKFALVPNRYMPEDQLFFFNPADWTQMVFRAPQRTKLAKTGSYEKWMIEMEVGLRHRNPYASGILKVTTAAGA